MPQYLCQMQSGPFRLGLVQAESPEEALRIFNVNGCHVKVWTCDELGLFKLTQTPVVVRISGPPRMSQTITRSDRPLRMDTTAGPSNIK